MLERIPEILLTVVIAATLILLPYLGRQERQRDERRPTEELHIKPPRH
jgi:hypothetical protein